MSELIPECIEEDAFEDMETLTDDAAPPLLQHILHGTAEWGLGQPIDLGSVGDDEDSNTPYQLMQSQEEAYHCMLTSRLTTTQGPPGSGKTHYSGACMLRLIARATRRNIPFRILVTGFTHTA